MKSFTLRDRVRQEAQKHGNTFSYGDLGGK